MDYLPPPPLAYSQEESEHASAQWMANCGPHSIAAVTGLCLADVRPALGDFKGWMNPTMVTHALRQIGKPFAYHLGLNTSILCDGINRVQWEGDWMNPGEPAWKAYRQTHYVAHFSGWVLCTAVDPVEWIEVEEWRAELSKTQPPFRITHHWVITSRMPAAALWHATLPRSFSLPGLEG